MEIINKLNKLNLDELETFCFNNFDEYGMSLILYLYEKFSFEENEGIAIIISKLLDTSACHWEGVDFFKLNLYEKVLKVYPNSEIFLVSILSFNLAPYYGSMNKYFDFDKYKNRLLELSPSNPILKMV